MDQECGDPEDTDALERTPVVHAPSEIAGPGSVSVARTGERTFQGRNDHGTIVHIGPAGTPGHFSPGELLKLALAACAGMSADRGIARRLGEDAAVTIWAHGTSEPDNRYDAILEEVLLDLGALDETERETLGRVVRASIERGCTIERSVGEQIDVTTEIVDRSPRSGPQTGI